MWPITDQGAMAPQNFTPIIFGGSPKSQCFAGTEHMHISHSGVAQI